MPGRVRRWLARPSRGPASRMMRNDPSGSVRISSRCTKGEGRPPAGLMGVLGQAFGWGRFAAAEREGRVGGVGLPDPAPTGRSVRPRRSMPSGRRCRDCRHPSVRPASRPRTSRVAAACPTAAGASLGRRARRPRSRRRSAPRGRSRAWPDRRDFAPTRRPRRDLAPVPWLSAPPARHGPERRAPRTRAVQGRERGAGRLPERSRKPR